MIRRFPSGRAEADMLNELQSWWQSQTWWQEATPETKAAIWDGGLALAAFLGGLIAGGIVRRTLRSWSFDGLIGQPSTLPPGVEPARGLTPTRVVTMLVRLTVWAAAGGWLAAKYGRPDINEIIRLVIVRGWALTGVLGAVLAVGGLLSRRVTDALHDPSQAGPAYRNGSTSHRGVANAVGAGVYGLVLLLALLITADAFDWPMSRTAAAALWQLVQRLLTIAAALLVCYLGARWARALSAPPAEIVTPAQKAGQFTALALVGGTTFGCVLALLSSGSGVILWLLAVPALGVLLWVGRGYLPDVLAGAKLRSDKVSTVWFDGAAWQVSGVGLLTAEVGRGGESARLRNRQVLEAVHGASALAGRH
jgi:hypothetical protein